MPPEQVIMAVDYIKRHVLKGERYNNEKIPVVALELRKFLSSNTEEKQRVLQELADANHEQYEATRQTMLRERALREEYERRLEKAEEELERAIAASTTQQEAIDQIQRTQGEDIARYQGRELARKMRDRRILLSVSSVATAIVLGYFNQPLALWIAANVHLDTRMNSKLALVLGFIRVGLLLAPLLFFIASLKGKQQIRTALIALVVIVWFWLAGVQASTTLGEMSNAATVALYFALFLTFRGD
jgi:flagellar biosynthesis GTPase FlhF